MARAPRSARPTCRNGLENRLARYSSGPLRAGEDDEEENGVQYHAEIGSRGSYEIGPHDPARLLARPRDREMERLSRPAGMVALAPSSTGTTKVNFWILDLGFWIWRARGLRLLLWCRPTVSSRTAAERRGCSKSKIENPKSQIRPPGLHALRGAHCHRDFSCCWRGGIFATVQAASPRPPRSRAVSSTPSGSMPLSSLCGGCS